MYISIHYTLYISTLYLYTLHTVHIHPLTVYISIHYTLYISRPLNLLTLFTVRATPFHSEIGLSHSEICVRLSQSTRFRGTKHFIQFMCIADFLSRSERTWMIYPHYPGALGLVTQICQHLKIQYKTMAIIDHTHCTAHNVSVKRRQSAVKLREVPIPWVSLYLKGLSTEGICRQSQIPAGERSQGLARNVPGTTSTIISHHNRERDDTAFCWIIISNSIHCACEMLEQVLVYHWGNP